MTQITEIKQSNSYNYFDYLLLFLLLQGQFIGFLLDYSRIDLLFGSTAFIFIIFRKRKLIIDKKIIALFIIYMFITLLQGLYWGFNVISLFTSFLLSFLVPYYIYLHYKFNFFYFFERIIYVLTIISLSIWLCHQFIPALKVPIETTLELLNINNSTIRRYGIFYTYWSQLDQASGLSRNAGFSWEPGAFAVLIIYGIAINYVHNKSLTNRRNIPYYIALLSTFSTAGYISLGIIGLLLIKQKRNRAIGLLLFPIFIYLAYNLYTNVEFLQKKVELQIKEQSEKSLDAETEGRIMGARKSIYVLTVHPIIGRGLLHMTKPKDLSDPEYADYGWISYISRFGLVFGLFFMFFFIKGIYRFVLTGGHSFYDFLIITLAIMINLSSQVGIGSFYFMIFFFLGLYKFRLSSENVHPGIQQFTK